MNRSIRFLTLIALTVFMLPVQAQTPERGDLLRQAQVDVVYLASDLLGGRGTDTEGERMAAEYLVERFEEMGLAPGMNGSWFQPFEFSFSANPHGGGGESRTGTNVGAFLDNGAANTVIIGAHYDHLGMGGQGSRSPGVEAIHNGADDNASGTAALLAIAEYLTYSPAKSNNYLFLAFSAEELGLVGSKKYVEAMDLDGVSYMINLDMVGRLNEERSLAVNGIGTAPEWDAAVDAAADVTGLSVARHESGLGPSDHATFYLEELPVLHLFTGQHEDYHKPEDDSELINYDGLIDVAMFAAHVVESLDATESLTFTKTQDETQGRRMSFKVTMGVMPDYVYDGGGLKVDGVMDGRPAELAGLERGDIVIRIGDLEIGDVYAYMEALGTFEPGDETTVVVKRGEEEVALQLTWQAPAGQE